MLAVVAFAVALQSPFTDRRLNRLIDASATAITSPRGSIKGESLGRFETAIGEAQAFRTDFDQLGFHRRYVFLIRPAKLASGPVSVMLTSDARVDQLARNRGDSPPLFVDLYTCNMHTTLGILAREPSFEELRTRVIAELQNAASSISSTPPPVGLQCGFGSFVLPGLGGR